MKRYFSVNSVQIHSDKRLTVVVSIVVVALLMIIFVMSLLLIMLVINSPVKLSPQEMLMENIQRYQYFLGDSEIVEYRNPSMGQGDSDIYIETSVAVEKIPELLEASILKDCEADGFTCGDPVWYESAPKRTKTGGSTPWRIMRGGVSERCTSAVDIRYPSDRRTDVCVNITTGRFVFSRVRI